MVSARFSIITFFILIIAGIYGCKSTESVTQKKGVKAATESGKLAAMFDTSKVFNANITGFALYDPAEDSMIYAQYEDRYFTPASNTKLFTFYTGLKLLPDSIKALEYVVRGDSLIFWGTGDPSFLHPDFGNGKVYQFLKQREEKLYFSDSNFNDDLLGPGWSWSDYQYYYQTEKTPLPMYGNVARFKIQEIKQRRIAPSDSGLSVSPGYFQRYIQDKEISSDKFLSRGMANNKFEYQPKSDTASYTIEKPFHYSPELITKMLSDTLNKSVEYVNRQQPTDVQSIYSIAADTAYKRMLQPRDNFIAEQLLFVAASEMGKALNSKAIIKEMKSEHLGFLSSEPQWADGSGLSRYNLFTPQIMVELLQAIDQKFDSDKALFNLLAAGGKRGTIKNWYANKKGDTPYVFAKTGTLSNNHCLSGYLITESGKKLILSFMNNHYVTSSSVVKKEMEKILWHIHQNY